MERLTKPLYDLPEYYDVAFSWDLSSEIEFFGQLFAAHVPFEVKRILEPACGTGRFLVALPGRGYRVRGYDVNPRAVAYARRKIAASGALRLEAIYDEKRRPVSLDAAIAGERGNHCYVLKAV